MEAPGQKNAGRENRVVIKDDGGVWDGAEGAAKHHASGQQEHASGKNQGLDGFGAPQIHAWASFRKTVIFWTVIL
jgi:hypothetical protein